MIMYELYGSGNCYDDEAAMVKCEGYRIIAMLMAEDTWRAGQTEVSRGVCWDLQECRGVDLAEAMGVGEGYDVRV